MKKSKLPMQLRPTISTFLLWMPDWQLLSSFTSFLFGYIFLNFQNVLEDFHYERASTGTILNEVQEFI